MGTRTKVSRLRKWRLDNGFYIGDVSDLTGLSESMLSRVERGERGLRPATKVRVARALGVRVADLFDPDGDLPPGGPDDGD